MPTNLFSSLSSALDSSFLIALLQAEPEPFNRNAGDGSAHQAVSRHQAVAWRKGLLLALCTCLSLPEGKNGEQT